MDIQNLTHPEYDLLSLDWLKWRLTYKGGRDFITEYLKKLSLREDDTDFSDRRDMSYCPAFAKAAINEIKNSIYQRMSDISRIGGSKSYQDAVKALNDGVNLRWDSMDSYLGCEVLIELLVMAKVGIFVDMPQLSGQTVAETATKHPYLYTYTAEDIRSWAYDLPGQPNEFSHLLLCDHLYERDSDTYLPNNKIDRFRYLRVVDNHVQLSFFDSDGSPIDIDGAVGEATYTLNIPKIPFILASLPTSLMSDVADYQIALLNLESADINYARKANFPFYTEQYDPRTEGSYNKQANVNEGSDTGHEQEIKTGPTQGRRYPINTDRPAFINPSSEPLKVSMEKGAQLREDIRQLVNLSLSNLNPKMASAESKAYDNQGLESGLSFIGLTLEKCERQIAAYWSMYEGGSQATITYPRNYSLKTEDDRQKEAESKRTLMDTIPSDTYRRATAKEIARITLSGKVTDDEMSKIYEEIDNAPTMTSDAKIIALDLENGLVTTDTASLARGYKAGEAEKAKVERAERIAQTMVAQTSPGQARGIPDMQVGQPTASDEKIGQPKRGEGK